MATGVRTRFTSDSAGHRHPIWSPDGSRIVFASDRTGHSDLYVKNSTGAGNAEVLLASGIDKIPTDWSRDGRFIVFTSTGAKGKAASDIWLLPLFGDKKPFPFLETEFDNAQAVFSPDGHWLAYQANDSGDFEIYISPFPGPGGRWKVSQGGGSHPAWRLDGKGLYFLGPGDKLMEADVSTKRSAAEVGAPKLILQTSFAYFDDFLRPYDVAPDGKRFLVLSPQISAPVPITLVTNWSAGFNK